MALSQTQINALGSIVGDWHFNDLSTLTVDGGDNISDVEDQSSAGNDLSNLILAQQAKYVSGIFRGIGGARFGHSGVENYYQIPYLSHLTGTIVAVVQLDESASFSRDISPFLISTNSGNLNRRGFNLRHDDFNGNLLAFYSSIFSWRDSRQVVGNGQVAVVAWQQSEDNIRITFNGVEILNTSIGSQSSAVDTFTVGTSLPGGDEWHDGVIFRATAYSDLLSDSDVLSLVNSHLEGYINPVKPGIPVLDLGHPLASNVSGAYLFNEKSGSQLVDASGNNRNGVLGKDIGAPVSVSAAELSLQGVSTDGVAVFETTALILFGRLASNQINTDPPIQGSPNNNADCAYFDNKIYVALSSSPSPIAGDAQIAICNADSAAVESIIDLSVNGPFDPSGCHVESDGAGGADVYVSGYDPDEGFSVNGLYHYNVSAGDVVTFQGILSFQINLPFVRGVSRDALGNWYFVVFNTANLTRNWLFRFNSIRDLTGVRFLPFTPYLEVKGVDATTSNVLVGYRESGIGTSSYAEFDPVSLFDMTGSPRDGNRVNFDESDTDNWFAAIPIKMGSAGSILTKFDPVSIYSNNSYLGSLNDDFDWEGYTNSTGGSNRDGGDVNYRIESNIRDSVQFGVGERISAFTYDLAANEAIYLNGYQDDSGPVSGAAQDHHGVMIVGGLSNNNLRSDVNFDLLVFFDRELSQAEVESLSSTGDPFSLFEPAVLVTALAELQSQSSVMEGVLLVSSSVSGEISSASATMEGSVVTGVVLLAEIQSDPASLEGVLSGLPGSVGVSGVVQSQSAFMTGVLDVEGSVAPDPSPSLLISLDRYIDIDSNG